MAKHDAILLAIRATRFQNTELSAFAWLHKKTQNLNGCIMQESGLSIYYQA